MKRIVELFILLSLFVSNVYATIDTLFIDFPIPLGSYDWDDPRIWKLGRPPLVTDSVYFLMFRGYSDTVVIKDDIEVAFMSIIYQSSPVIVKSHVKIKAVTDIVFASSSLLFTFEGDNKILLGGDYRGVPPNHFSVNHQNFSNVTYFECRNLYQGRGSKITFPDTLRLKGSYFGSRVATGTVDPRNGLVIFDGLTDQSINSIASSSGQPASAPIVFNNVIVDKLLGKLIITGYREPLFNGAVDLKNGIIDCSGFTVKINSISRTNGWIANGKLAKDFSVGSIDSTYSTMYVGCLDKYYPCTLGGYVTSPGVISVGYVYDPSESSIYVVDGDKTLLHKQNSNWLVTNTAQVINPTIGVSCDYPGLYLPSETRLLKVDLIDGVHIASCENPKWVKRSVTQLSGNWNVATTGSFPLPILELVVLNNNRLSWNYYESFESISIEHSVDLNNWQVVSVFGDKEYKTFLMEKYGFYRAVVDEKIYSNSIYFELTQDFTIYIVDSYKTDSIRISEKNVKEVCVYNIMGGQILSEKVRKDENVISISLDHSNQIFIIKVILDDGRVITKKIFG